MLASESFMLNVYSQLGHTPGEFRALQLIVLAMFGVTYHLSPVT